VPKIFNIAILASGGGSNAQKIIDFQRNKDCNYKVVLLASNRKNSFALQRAQAAGIDHFHFSDSDLISAHFLSKFSNIDFIILAGFLSKIPESLIQKFEDRIINIHPSLLPAHGGKGMYGIHVHKAVKGNKEMITGLTIHLVNENYDDGKIIFQAAIPVTENDSAQDIASNVLALEHKFYPKVISEWLQDL